MSTDFLQGLEPFDGAHPAAITVLRFLAETKNIPDPQQYALGWEPDEDKPDDRCYFFYLRTDRDNGVLEVLTSPQEDGTWSRRVVDFIGDRDEIAGLVGTQVGGGVDPGDGVTPVFAH